MDFSEKEESDKKEESNKDEPIVLPSLPTSRLAELSSNKVGEAKLRGARSKRSSTIE